VTLFNPKRLNSFCAHSRILQSLGTLLFFKLRFAEAYLLPAAKLRKLSTQKKFPCKIFLGGSTKQLDGIGERSIFEGIRQIQLSNASKKYTKQTCLNTTVYYLIRKFYSVYMVVMPNFRTTDR